MGISLWLFFGILGLALLLLAFSLDAFAKKMDNARLLYVLNCAGSALLMTYAWRIESMPFLILEGFWFVVSAIKLAKH